MEPEEVFDMFLEPIVMLDKYRVLCGKRHDPFFTHIMISSKKVRGRARSDFNRIFKPTLLQRIVDLRGKRTDLGMPYKEIRKQCK